MQHPPRFWKHKESKEVIDHLTYSDLNNEHRANYDECDVTGELLNEPENTDQLSTTTSNNNEDDGLVGSLDSYVEAGLLTTDGVSSSNDDNSSQNDFGGFDGGNGVGGGADASF